MYTAKVAALNPVSGSIGAWGVSLMLKTVYFLSPMTDADQPARLRWARSQRFRLSPRGVEAEQQWRTTLETVQSAGRAAFDSGLAHWATEFKVQPDDASYVRELKASPLRLEDVAKAVADTGTSREDVKKALERLYEAGLVEVQPGA